MCDVKIAALVWFIVVSSAIQCAWGIKSVAVNQIAVAVNQIGG